MKKCISNRCKDSFKQKKIFWGKGHSSQVLFRTILLATQDFRVKINLLFESYRYYIPIIIFE